MDASRLVTKVVIVRLCKRRLDHPRHDYEAFQLHDVKVVATGALQVKALSCWRVNPRIRTSPLRAGMDTIISFDAVFFGLTFRCVFFGLAFRRFRTVHPSGKHAPHGDLGCVEAGGQAGNEPQRKRRGPLVSCIASCCRTDSTWSSAAVPASLAPSSACTWPSCSPLCSDVPGA